MSDGIEHERKALLGGGTGQQHLALQNDSCSRAHQQKNC